ncbi:MAG: DUF2795 domain-containing protein [Methanolobus sp.]|uniref:DUF2795 domain-containing protein n=1 Tax=Methanolobus sp. TaxID=1874737 RepID=UPI00028AA246|nr:DUF2795 domain-containing protein [Methanolobus sp.]AFV25172.1 hypothetical protein Mpsy_2973 [Methanolobus psychrophilus R15]MDP2216983.1 DUF2795 domain-containing protein [Methanolobus sp.]
MKSNVIEVQEALKGIDYPKAKKEVIKYAKDNKASKDVMADLKKISDRKYETAAELSKEFSGK